MTWRITLHYPLRILSYAWFVLLGPWTLAADNAPPAGFKSLFNGKDLTGWKGLVADPPKRASMTAPEMKAAQEAADKRMHAHWNAADGILVFDGQGDNLCTDCDYGDFELLIDWRIEANGDSGIYLRGAPQVQIWDPKTSQESAVGSGGLFNNENGVSKPLVVADRPIGDWNRFRIRMIGHKVTVWLNNKLVVDEVAMENYWERGRPIYSKGPIEL